MKYDGIVRTVDKQGRVVLPNEMRKQVNIEKENDSVEIFLSGDDIIIRKHRPACFICNTLDEIVHYNGYNICVNCIENLQKLKEEM